MTCTHGNSVSNLSRNFSFVLVRKNGHNFVDTYQNDLISKPNERRLLDLQLLSFEFSQISTVGRTKSGWKWTDVNGQNRGKDRTSLVALPGLQGSG